MRQPRVSRAPNPTWYPVTRPGKRLRLLLLAIRRMVREEEGRPPSAARIDALLDERAATILSSSSVEPT
jgi:hypothetical protein